MRAIADGDMIVGKAFAEEMYYCLGCFACTTACPVDALKPDAYDVPACKADLDRPGNDCRARGCAVRRACPVSQAHARAEAQSAFHMGYFA